MIDKSDIPKTFDIVGKRNDAAENTAVQCALQPLLIKQVSKILMSQF